MRKIHIVVIFLGFIAQVLPNCVTIRQNGNNHCNRRGCYYDEFQQRCRECERCSENHLMTECHPPECRGLPFPQFCSLPSDEDRVLTKMVEISLGSPLLGNFSQHEDKWRVFLYNENFQQGIYTRVGKVCAHEWEKDKSDWNTFQKARLLCSSDVEGEFNIIADIKKIGEEDPRYYGFFTKARIGSERSAVCVFTIQSITRVITQGEFMDPLAISRGGELELDKGCLPKTRPGVCKARNLTEWETAFVRTHSLMFDTIEASSLLLTGPGHFTTVAYHEKVAIDGMAYTVFSIGTEEGKVLRYLETESGEVNFLEEIVFIPEVGKILTLTENGTHLLVSSEEEHSLPIPLHRCNEMPNCSCHQDPYCAWDFVENKCKEFVVSKRDNFINQSAGVIARCSRGGPAKVEPLVVTNYSLTPTSPAPGEGVVKPTDGTGLVKSTDNGPSNGLYMILVLFICVIVFVGIGISAAVYRSRKCRGGSNLLPAVELTDTTIKVISNSSDWKIGHRRPKKIRRWGRVVGSVFNNLSPLTEYTVTNNPMSYDITVTTKGPTVEVLSDSITTSSVECRIDGWNNGDYSSFMVMSPHYAFSDREKLIISSTVTMDGLVPNMEYTVKLRLSHSSSGCHNKEVTVGVIKTKEESFRVESRDGKDILAWDELNKNVSSLRFEGCCFLPPAASSLTDLQNGWLPLGILPVRDVNNCKVVATMDVMGSIKDWTVAESVRDLRDRGEDHKTLDGGEECSKTISSLKSLSVIDRQSLGQKVALRHSVYRVYCKALGHREDEADVMFEIGRQGPGDKFLNPLIVRDDDKLKELFAVLGQTLCDLARDKPPEWLDDCKGIYEFMEALYEHHSDCTACRTICKNVKHKWVCCVLSSQQCAV